MAVLIFASAVLSVVSAQSSSDATWSTSRLSYPRTNLAAVSVGSKSLFAGGFRIVTDSQGNAAFVASSVVDVYTIGTGAWSTAQLSEPRWGLAATSVGDTALFAGGEANSGALLFGRGAHFRFITHFRYDCLRCG